MSKIDLFWATSTVVLSLVAWFRFRAGLQPKGSLVIACTMGLAAIAIVCEAVLVAEILQIGGIGVAAAMIFARERWKRNDRVGRT